MEDSTRISLLISQALGLYRLRINALLIQNELDLTSEMCAVLRLIWKKEGQKQRELASQLYKDKGSITKIIDNLEKRKLVERISDETDARNKNIRLTSSGRALEKRVLPLLDSFLNEITASIEAQELEITRRVLQEIIGKLS
ncbi:MarR family winged helix-turn-helix transcriptional regulator [Pedobacter cryoconitis]|uniref:DNA-binding MarR family transcriptional regulator n=1 Tax=Pedobacter cryoconitis TaxID=188932 RepID=A0A7X0MK10_9SPHI|nr:MarR family transcriptional regulator [Pedobacter cryoconitis]MBB6501709.1 DNA-binding MarR family transcriptional regulator [Pedobacter cryoconitis]